jgi:hypothetical protein
MKIKILLLALFISTSCRAQFGQYNPNEGMLAGGAGITWINGAPNYSFRIFPEFQFSKIGIGLDLNFEYTASGNLRSENFNEFSDYLSIIRYIRYGQKGDPFYARLGALDYATLGHGSIMYLYNNSPSFDSRKVGIELDADFTNYGFESVYGNFGKEGLIGMRGYLRPLQFTELSDIPIIGMLETGITLVSDLNENAGIISGGYDSTANVFIPKIDEGNTTIVGLDLGLPVLRTSVVDLDAYIDYAKIIKFGSGVATGLSLNFKGFGLLNLRAKLERRFNGNHYLPSYFNSFYEIERFRLDKQTGVVSSKIQQLKFANDQTNGYYGEVYASLLGLFRAIGSYQKLDRQPKSGILHVAGELTSKDFPYMIRAGYDKINIENIGDIFTMDDRSFLYAELGYKIQQYLMLSMIYYWTYEPVRDVQKNIIGYKTQKRVEPRLSFIYPIKFN